MLWANSWYNNRREEALETPLHILINVHGKGVTMTTSDSTTKICTKCKQTYPATLEFFGTHKTSKDGFNTWCRQCMRKNSKNWADTHPDRVRENRRRYCATHIEDNRERARRWYAEHRERGGAKAKEWRERNPEKRQRICQRWIKSHPAYNRAKEHRRRSRKLSAGGSELPFDEHAQLKRQHGKCYYCQSKLTKYHIEHVIPLSRGGSDHPDNKVLACPSCNLSKHDKLPHEWSKGGRLC